MLKAIAEYDFLQNALIAGILASIICGVIGVVIVEKRLLMMTGGIAHTAYGGVGLGYLLGFEPIIGAGIFSIISALIIGTVRRKGGVHTDIIISILWSLGMAFGVAFVNLMQGYPPDMNSYLFGNILSVTKTDISIMLPMTLAVLLTIIIFYNDWKAYLFDSRFAKVLGIKTVFLEYLLLVLTALSIVVLIRVVGIILVIALLTAPAACAALISKSLKGRMLTATALSGIFCFAGLIISYNFNTPSGASVVFVSGITYFALLIIKKCITKGR